MLPVISFCTRVASISTRRCTSSRRITSPTVFFFFSFYSFVCYFSLDSLLYDWIFSLFFWFFFFSAFISLSVCLCSLFDHPNAFLLALFFLNVSPVIFKETQSNPRIALIWYHCVYSSSLTNSGLPCILHCLFTTSFFALVSWSLFSLFLSTTPFASPHLSTFIRSILCLPCFISYKTNWPPPNLLFSASQWQVPSGSSTPLMVLLLPKGPHRPQTVILPFSIFLDQSVWDLHTNL